jgi:hypothetical protein
VGWGPSCTPACAASHLAPPVRIPAGPVCTWTPTAPSEWSALPGTSCLAQLHHTSLELGTAVSECGLWALPSVVHSFPGLAGLNASAWVYTSRITVATSDVLNDPEGTVKTPETTLGVAVYVPVGTCLRRFPLHLPAWVRCMRCVVCGRSGCGMLGVFVGGAGVRVGGSMCCVCAA